MSFILALNPANFFSADDKAASRSLELPFKNISNVFAMPQSYKKNQSLL